MTDQEAAFVEAIAELTRAAPPSSERDAVAADLAALQSKHASGEYAVHPTGSFGRDLAHLEARARALATGGAS